MHSTPEAAAAASAPISSSSSSPSSSFSPSAPSSLGTLPACCTEAFKEHYRRGEVPQFGCYDPVYLRQAFDTSPTLDSTTRNPTHASFFPSFSSLVRAYADHGATSLSLPPTSRTMNAPAADEDTDQGTTTMTADHARSRRSWECITSAEDMWNGPPLTMKIPPASDYERILLDRAL
ncbi:hypothetical_protein [Leishmania braziliensis MHOM/BR/75/M2904]|uniref:Hypothetical_protein n=1 Tax=Leishmania braziliensis MHOM/BR/75/M2904 TaxID=420245 RepID=A0A3P3ZFX3_LEIBR|nr:unnamed protein product [Leishmania braziliensis]CAJ2479923.1 unnamed protein product [Leishmania braziliensis]SYZ69173.1 hypothetical_protein [Leishmania braziliensis MHOM/BR/75/M2904]